MKTIRLIFLSVLLLGVTGCAGNGSRVVESDTGKPVIKKEGEGVALDGTQNIKKDETGPLTEAESPAISSELPPKASGALSEKRVSMSGVPAEAPLKKEGSSMTQIPSSKSEGQMREVLQGTGKQKKKTLQEKGMAPPSPPNKVNEKRPETKVTATMDVAAEKKPLKKKSTVNIKGGPGSEADVPSRLQIIIPDQSVNGSSQFIPKVLKIKAGERVVWVNQDMRVHFINKKPEISSFSVFVDVDEEEEDEDEGGGNKNEGFSNSPLLQPGLTWGQVFTKKGTYKYYCFTHPLEMRGTIVVE
ncbi:MAG: plastocyanin/azurin family copper-binding protein [Nitrospinota bacterium]